MRPTVRRIMFAARALRSGVGRILKILLAVLLPPTVCPDARTVPGTSRRPHAPPFRPRPAFASPSAGLRVAGRTPRVGPRNTRSACRRRSGQHARSTFRRAMRSLRSNNSPPQSGEQLLYSVDDIQGVQTHAVQGELHGDRRAESRCWTTPPCGRAKTIEPRRSRSLPWPNRLPRRHPPSRPPRKPEDLT